MSSNEDEHIDGDDAGTSRDAKKRKIQRACDVCRRKKIRCDGSQMKDNICSSCIAAGFDCTYIEAAKKRGPSKGYVEGLEIKIHKMEKLIRQLCPDESTFRVLMGAVDSKAPVMDLEQSPTSAAAASSVKEHAPTILDSLASAIRGGSQVILPEDEDEKLAYMLSERVKCMRIEPSEYRFFGKSSGAILVQRAMEARSNYIGADIKHFNPIVSGFRPEFWTLKEWEKIPHIMPPETPFDFPDPDLLPELIDLYFKNINLYMPLFHRPTFLRNCGDGLHLQDTSFAVVLLLVCAVGARFSDDPRTRYEGEGTHSGGWKWFKQAINLQKTFVSPHNLYDLQFYPVAVQFLSASAVPQACWSLIGIGLRVAQDLGVHRRGLPKLASAEEELKKRCFWVLLVLDRIYGSALGRPCGIHDEDFDLDLPLDCDDEYWNNDDPMKRFIQPDGKPSKISAFIWMIKLMRIVTVTLKTIYAINKSKVLFGVAGNDWKATVITELDSALTVWKESLPLHLRWDPNREHEDFANQSLALHANYYNTQIIIHRPFIPTPSRPSPFPFPSLAICTSAARSCSHLVDLKKVKRGGVPAVMIHGPVCTAALVLLLNLWSNKRTGITQEITKKDMQDVYSCMEVLKASESRYHAAGRLRDVVRYLADAGDFPLPERPSKKRHREDFVVLTESVPEQSTTKKSPWNRSIAGSARVSKDKSKPSPSSTSSASLDAPSPQGSIPSSEAESMADQSSAFTTPATQSQPLVQAYPDQGAALLRAFTVNPSDPQYSSPAQSRAHQPSASPTWFPFHSNVASSGSSSPMSTSQQQFSFPLTSNVPVSSTQAQTFSSPFTVNPSAISSTMFSMDDSIGPLRPGSEQFGVGGMQDSSMHLGDGMYSQPMNLIGVDAGMPSSQQGFSDGLGGMGPDLMDISVWSNSPAGLLFQDFAPYLAQLNGQTPSSQPQASHQSSGHASPF